MYIRTKKKKKSGIVYCLMGGGFFKIGCTQQIHARLERLATNGPWQLHTAHIIKTDDIHGVEGYWHKRFEKQRQNGEWFVLDKSDLNALMEFHFATIDACGRYVALDQTTLTELLQTQEQKQPNRKGQKPTMAIDFSKHMGSSGYLKAVDIDATDDEEMVLVIYDVNEVYSESLQKEQIEVSFEDFEKKLTLNVTNTKKLVELFGANDEDWIGKKIKLYSDDSKTPTGQACRTIKIKPVKKRGEAEAAPVAAAPARRATTAAQDVGTDQPRRRAAGATAVAEKEEDPEEDPFKDE